MAQSDPTTTLIAVTGLSPAIVTETLWALAHESPPVLPERIIFITTSTGANILEDQLFTPNPELNDRSVWDHFRRALNASPDQLIAETPRIITLSDGSAGRAVPLDDIRSPAESNASAQAIFSEVWNVVQDPGQRLIASIAGGRKTMGALLHSAISLIGRETDRVTHVLVDPPFDTLPDFFYPGQPTSPLLSRDGRAFEPADARIHLADVPFVPLLETPMNGLIRRIAGRQVSPVCSCSQDPKNTIQNGSTITPRPPLRSSRTGSSGRCFETAFHCSSVRSIHPL